VVCEERLTSSAACGSSCFPHQTSQRRQVEPGVGQEDERLAPWGTVDGHTFESPPFEGSVASFDGIAGAVVDTLPGRSAHRDVPHETSRAVLEALADVDDLAMRVVFMVGVKALVRGIGDAFHRDDGCTSIEAGLAAEPLVTLAVGVEAVGGEGIAMRTHRAAFIVVAAHDPSRFVLVGLVSAQVDDATGVKVVVHHTQNDAVAEASIPSDGIHVEVRVEGGELE